MTKKPTPKKSAKKQVRKPAPKSAPVQEAMTEQVQEVQEESFLSDAKRTHMKSTLTSLIKEYGREAIIQLNQSTTDVECWSSQIPNFDDILSGDSTPKGELIPGTGLGWPKGRIIELYGPESSGKTTLAFAMIAGLQKAGGSAVYVDAEHSVDKQWAQKLGVNITELGFIQPDSAEKGLELVSHLSRNGGFDLIVVDSVAALVPELEQNTDEHTKQPALQARLMGEYMRKLSPLCSKSGTTILFLNQLRLKIGVMFGNPETTPGGNALKFYASIRLDIRKQQILKGAYKGIRSKIKVVKNKIAPPLRECFIDIQSNGEIKSHAAKEEE